MFVVDPVSARIVDIPARFPNAMSVYNVSPMMSALLGSIEYLEDSKIMTGNEQTIHVLGYDTIPHSSFGLADEQRPSSKRGS